MQLRESIVVLKEDTADAMDTTEDITEVMTGREATLLVKRLLAVQEPYSKAKRYGQNRTDPS